MNISKWKMKYKNGYWMNVDYIKVNKLEKYKLILNKDIMPYLIKESWSLKLYTWNWNLSIVYVLMHIVACFTWLLFIIMFGQK